MPSNFYSANVTIIKLQRNISISVHYFVRIAYTYYTHYDSDTRSLRYTSNGNPSLTQLFSEILKYSYQPLFYNSKFSTILSDNDTLNDKTLDNRSIQLHAFPKPKYTYAWSCNSTRNPNSVRFNSATYTYHKHVARFASFQISRTRACTARPRNKHLLVATCHRGIRINCKWTSGPARLASEQGWPSGTSYVAERVIIYLLDGWRARRPARGCENELRPAR